MATLGLWLLQNDLARLLMQTGWVARLVLLILLGFSILSWAVIYRKYGAFRLVRAQTERFLESFRAAQRLPEAGPLAKAFAASPLARLYAAAMKEVEAQRGAAGKNPHPPVDTGAVAAALQVASAGEVAQLERWMGFLATTGSVTPFIGLFGTVWGIIDAFMGLGESGATTIRAVAPGIAEALITTAAGLFAAIPAIIAYNYFLHQVRRFATRMENFTLEFLARVEKTSA